MQAQPHGSTPQALQDPSPNITEDYTVIESGGRSLSGDVERSNKEFQVSILQLLQDISRKVDAAHVREPSVITLLQSISRKVEETQLINPLLQDISRHVDGTQPALDQFKSAYQQDRQRDRDQFRRLEKCIQETYRNERLATGDQDLQPKIKELIARNDALQVENEELEGKNEGLRKANDEYAERLISLQPSRRELLPKVAVDVGNEKKIEETNDV